MPPKCAAVLVFSLFSFVCSANAQQASSDKYTPALDITAMDRSIDPCVDFFAYACGGWIKSNPIPPDQSSWDLYSKMEDENKTKLRGILEAASTPDAGRNAVNQKIGDYYASCMDEKAIEDKGIEPLKPGLDRIAKISSKSELADAASAMTTDNVMFRFESIQDFRDANQFVANADQGGLGLPDRDYYLKTDAKSETLRKAYVAHVQKMFQLLGDSPDTAAAEAQTVMRIETALAKGSMTRVERRDPKSLDHKLTSGELEKISPEFHWQVYFTKVGLPSLSSLNVAVPNFFKTLNEEIGKDSVDEWKTYLRWHLVHASAAQLSSPFLNENFAFYGKTLQGQQQLKPRWKRCTEYVDDYWARLSARLMLRSISALKPRSRRSTIVKEIQRRHGAGHPQPDLDVARHEAAGAREAARHGQQDRLSRQVARLLASSRSCAATISATSSGRRCSNPSASSAKIGKPVDRGEWDMTPPTVNAYYNPQMNDINFPAGVLQPPLFDPKLDDAPNYGNTGGTIGHELTHGFDDEGRQFDAQGNLQRLVDAGTTAKSSRSARAASRDQYSNYTIVDDIKINGKLTLGEDVADLGGLLLAYMAWKDDTKNQKLEPIDGFTPDQRFFVGYAQRAAESRPRESKRMRRNHRSAFAGEVPHQRSRLQHAGVPGGLSLQIRAADGE